MSLFYINIFFSTYSTLSGTTIHKSHLIFCLLCLDDIISLFTIPTAMMLNIYFILASIIPILLLVFRSCGETLELSLPVRVDIPMVWFMCKILTFFNDKTHYSKHYINIINTTIKKYII